MKSLLSSTQSRAIRRHVFLAAMKAIGASRSISVRFRALRIGTILVLFCVALGAINQLSLLIAPCNKISNLERQYQEKYNAAYYGCTLENGVVIQGIVLLSEI